MRVLVTGGAGFIGSAVCRYFVTERGATVLNVDKLTHTSSLASLAAISASPRYSQRKADVCNRARIDALLQAFEPDAIVHLAAAARDAGTDTLIETNVNGTIRVLEAAHAYWSALPAARREGFRVLHVSQLADAAAAPASASAASRVAAEQFALTWHKSSGLPVLVSRGAETFGPHQFPDQPIPQAILAALEGQTVTLGTGAEGRDWLYVDDHVRALAAILDSGRPGEAYDIGSGSARTGETIVRHIRELARRHAGQSQRSACPIATRQGEVAGEAGVIAATAKLERACGWRAAESIESALSKTVRWYIANPSWWMPLQQARLSGDRLGVLRIA